MVLPMVVTTTLRSTLMLLGLSVLGLTARPMSLTLLPMAIPITLLLVEVLMARDPRPLRVVVSRLRTPWVRPTTRRTPTLVTTVFPCVVVC